MFDAVGGGDAAAEMVVALVGTCARPGDRSDLRRRPAELLGISSPDDLWAAVVEAEPRAAAHVPRRGRARRGARRVRRRRRPEDARGSTATRAASRSSRARRRRSSPPSTPTLVYRAGLLHDLGRVAVPTGIWERPGPLRPEEWELVRLHPTSPGRILARSPVLAPLGPLASRHHERVDGSGYPAGVRASELDAGACLLAAADVLHALGEPRPHRAGARSAGGLARALGPAARPRRDPRRARRRRRAAARRCRRCRRSSPSASSTSCAGSSPGAPSARSPRSS